jgi:hypothetical protein
LWNNNDGDKYVAQRFDWKQPPVEQFNHGRNEKRQVGQDDAQKEKIARFSVQTMEPGNCNSDGHVERNSDGTAKSFHNC